jgi:hypothetical protein
VENNYFPKSCFYFFQNLTDGSGDFSPTLKSDSGRCLGPLAKFPFSGGDMRKKLRGKLSASPDFAPRDGLPSQKV